MSYLSGTTELSPNKEDREVVNDRILSRKNVEELLAAWVRVLVQLAQFTSLSVSRTDLVSFHDVLALWPIV